MDVLQQFINAQTASGDGSEQRQKAL